MPEWGAGNRRPCPVCGALVMVVMRIMDWRGVNDLMLWDHEA